MHISPAQITKYRYRFGVARDNIKNLSYAIAAITVRVCLYVYHTRMCYIFAIQHRHGCVVWQAHGGIQSQY